MAAFVLYAAGHVTSKREAIQMVIYLAVAIDTATLEQDLLDLTQQALETPRMVAWDKSTWSLWDFNLRLICATKPCRGQAPWTAALRHHASRSPNVCRAKSMKLRSLGVMRRSAG